MNLEGFSKRGIELGSDLEQINETNNNLNQEYLNTIERLALQKMKNDPLFEGSLEAAIRRLSLLGLNVSKESMRKNIENEVNKQRMYFNIEMPNISKENMNYKEQLIEILSQRYKRYDGVYRRNVSDSEVRYQYYSFDEIRTLDDIDINKIIQLYQSKTTKPLSINNRLLLLNCVYETIAGNKKYQELFDKLIDIYKIELDDKLTKPTTRYDDFNFVETNELYQASYTTMQEYSLVLADMCTRYIYEAQKSYIENSILPKEKFDTRIFIYEEIKSDFVKNNQQMPEVYEQIVSQAKAMVDKINEERNAKRQQKEIELQQEIVKMENERLEIKERIKTISRETFSSYFSKQISQRYPEEYQEFQKSKDLVRNHSSSATTVSDLKARFTKVSEDLQFYKGVLPVYEKYYQRFEEINEEIKKEREQQRIARKDQERINSDLNERLKKRRSLYSARNLGNQTIPSEQGMTYEQVVALINQKSAEEKVTELEENNDPSLDYNEIGFDYVNEMGLNYSEVVSKRDDANTSKDLTPTAETVTTPPAPSIEMKKDPIVEVKQEPTIKEVNIESIINRIKGQYPDVTMIEANGTFEYEGQYRVNVTNNNGTLTSIIVDKETYDQLEEYFKQHPQKILTHINKSKPIEKQIQQEQEMTPEKNKLINDIISAMLNAGEFHNSGTDISQKMLDIEYVKRNLVTKSMDELQMLLSTYQEQNVEEETMRSGMHR